MRISSSEMITDKYIIEALHEADERLELSLQRFSLEPNPTQQIFEDHRLEHLEKDLLDVKSIVSKIRDAAQKSVSKRYVSVDYNTIQKVIKDLPKEHSGHELALIERIVKDAISEYVMLICYYTLSNECLSFLPAAYDTRNYYQAVADSKLKSLLHTVQHLPVKIYEFTRKVYLRVENLNASRSTSRLSVDSLRRFGSDIYDELAPQFARAMMVRNFQLVGLPTQSKRWASLMFDLPRAMIRDELYNKTASLDQLTKDYTTNLGRLINEFQNSQHGRDIDSTVKLKALKKFLNLSSESTLCDVIEQTRKFHSRVKAMQVRKPGPLTRYWPTALLTLTYGPSSVIYIWEARYRILQFLQENVVDFAKGLLYNWVYIPLKHVWATVRHDDDSSIAVMSKGTLDSEMNSLTRMIVSFVNENSGSPINDNMLIEQVEHGDLTRFMEIYETQLRHPIKNIVSGELVRSLLIQVQKTKVDGSLALNGIDKMLQSQQLVFGVVAISPALLILYTTSVCLFRLIKLGTIWSNIQHYKDKLSSSLNNLERILNYSASNENEKYLNQGLLTIEVCNVAKLGTTLIPQQRLNEWVRDVGELIDFELDDKTKFRVINRIYHVYGRYF